MSTIDNYGEFEIPEEKTVIEVIEDPVKTVISCYEIFKISAKNIIKSDCYWCYKDDLREEIYQKGLKILEGKEKINLNKNETEEVMYELNKKADLYCDSLGLFLSALINTSQIKTILIQKLPEKEIIGYKLKKQKTIIMKEATNTLILGEHAEGNTINKGETDYQGLYAKGGVHINYGEIQYYLGGHAKGGLFINKKTVTSSICHDVFKGTSINQGSTHYMGHTGGVHINLKEVGEKETHCIDLSQQQNQLKTDLENKLTKIDFLKTNKDQLVKLVDEFNLNKFEKEVNAICKKIKNTYKFHL